MALIDRFPGAFTRQGPDWLPSIDDVVDDDLVTVARKSTLAAMQSVEPATALPFGVDIRLIGSTTHEGVLPADASPIIAAVQAEIDAAMPDRKVKFEIAGIARGSAVIRIEPKFATVDDTGDASLFDVSVLSDLELAMQKVMKVHDMLEGHADPAAIRAAGSHALIDSTKALADQLLANDLDLNVTARSSRGDIYESKVTKEGGSQWIEHVFQLYEAPDQEILVEGPVVAIDVDAGTLTVRGGARGGRVEIRKVPRQVLRDARFDTNVRIRVVERATTNRLARRTVTGHEFRDVAPPADA